MGGRRGRGKSMNMNRRLMGMDSGVGIDWDQVGGRSGENNGERGGTTVTEQQ